MKLFYIFYTNAYLINLVIYNTKIKKIPPKDQFYNFIYYVLTNVILYKIKIKLYPMLCSFIIVYFITKRTHI